MQTKLITNNFKDLKLVEELAKEAFPPEEYLAPAKIIEMNKKGEVEFLALYDNDLFVGFMVVSVFKNLVYLFFLAIDSKFRSCGYGGQALQLLDELYPSKQQVVDLEKLDNSAQNAKQRETRRNFYLRNGYKDTNKFLSYLGVDYEILCKDENFDFETFKEMMKTFSIRNFNPKYFEES